jgi:hypothetical protein
MFGAGLISPMMATLSCRHHRLLYNISWRAMLSMFVVYEHKNTDNTYKHYENDGKNHHLSAVNNRIEHVRDEIQWISALDIGGLGYSVGNSVDPLRGLGV